MPEDPPFQKPKRPRLTPSPGRSSSAPAYAELHCKTNFSFLEGASHPDELVLTASRHGYHALAITDRNSLAGVVRAHVAAKDVGLKLLIGAEITPNDAPPVLLLATDRQAYGRLCRLITTGRLRAPKGECHLTFDDIAQYADGLLACVLLNPCLDSEWSITPHKYHDLFGDRCYGLAELHYSQRDDVLLHRLRKLAEETSLTLVAGNDVHYHTSRRRFLQDVLTAIRHRCPVAELGHRRFPNGERSLKSSRAMLDLFASCPDAVTRTVEVADRCTFSLDELRYDYPEELCPPEMTRIDYLRKLTYAGAAERYPGGIPDKVRRIIEHELALIQKLRYESYFLTVWDIVKYARSQDVLCQGRGSAANSAVCYCLGVTSVDPDQIDVLFERFVSEERDEAPDIDVDFEHENREIVLQYLFDKYGRDRAGMTATVITYRSKSAVRDVGKALGLSMDRVDLLSKTLGHPSEHDQLSHRLQEAGLDPDSRVSRQLLALVQELLGFPRHLSQHVGGMVLTHKPLCEIAPIENAAMEGRTIIPWDKDNLDALGILKVDCLSLGMLTALHKSFDLLSQHYNRKLTLATVPQHDRDVYDMICKADTVGVFQIESRAQMSSLPLLRPKKWYDLVIQIAIIRPGPIQGDMVHPYRRRRNGEEEVTYPDDRIRDVLHKTLGVPLFQEQAMRLAIVAAGFSAGEADQLRRAMAAWRRTGDIDQFREKLINGMRENGYDAEFGERLFNMIRGFGQYGFPESHAASFARLAYASAWLKCHYPEAFTASLLNSQPMGFYGPSQLVRDARQHSVEVRPVDVNHSEWDCTLEPVESGRGTAAERRPFAVRMGFRMVKGLAESHAALLVAGRELGPYGSLDDITRRTGLGRPVLTRLSDADAFGSLSVSRRQATWQSLADRTPIPLFDQLPPSEATVELPEMTPFEEVATDYRSLSLSLRQHPLAFLRESLNERGVVTADRLPEYLAERWVRVGGLTIMRQRPQTAKGVTFVTLEDETGIINLIIWQNVWQKYRRIAGGAAVMLASGPLQRQNEVIHVLVHHLEDVSELLPQVHIKSRNFH